VPKAATLRLFSSIAEVVRLKALNISAWNRNLNLSLIQNYGVGKSPTSVRPSFNRAHTAGAATKIGRRDE